MVQRQKVGNIFKPSSCGLRVLKKGFTFATPERRLNTQLLSTEHTTAEGWTHSCWGLNTQLLRAEHTAAEYWTHSCWVLNTQLLRAEHTAAEYWTYLNFFLQAAYKFKTIILKILKTDIFYTDRIGRDFWINILNLSNLSYRIKIEFTLVSLR